MATINTINGRMVPLIRVIINIAACKKLKVIYLEKLRF